MTDTPSSSRPSVTIVTASLNRPSLQGACESIDGQTYDNWRHYVFGDGVAPTDYAHPRRTTIGFSRHLGADEPAADMPYGTPNPVLRWAIDNLELGDYFCILDDDNCYRPDFLEHMIAALEDADEGIAICALEDLRDSAPHDAYPELERCDMSGFVVRGDIAKKIGFPPEFPDRDAIGDFDFIKACADGYGWVRVPEKLVIYGAGPRLYPDSPEPVEMPGEQVQTREAFSTDLGRAVVGDAFQTLASLPSQSAQLIVCSPPFSGPRGCESDELGVSDHVDWLGRLADVAGHALAPDGSLIIELGCIWTTSRPIRRPVPFLALEELCRRGGWTLLQEFYWYNPQFLCSSVELTEDNPVRFRESATIILWLSRSDDPLVNRAAVERHYPVNLEQFGNLVSFDDGPHDRQYLDACKNVGHPAHPDRFPEDFPAFFTALLTNPGDLVVDPFAGSCATGGAAERLGRRWLCIDADEAALSSGRMRFEGP